MTMTFPSDFMWPIVEQVARTKQAIRRWMTSARSWNMLWYASPLRRTPHTQEAAIDRREILIEDRSGSTRFVFHTRLAIPAASVATSAMSHGKTWMMGNPLKIAVPIVVRGVSHSPLKTKPEISAVSASQRRRYVNRRATPPGCQNPLTHGAAKPDVAPLCAE